MKTLPILLLLFTASLLYSQNGAPVHGNAGFIENKGQIVNQDNKPNNKVRYLLNTPGLNVQLRDKGFSYDVFETEKKAVPQRYTDVHKPVKPGIDENFTFTSRVHRVDFDFKDTNPDTQIIVSGKSADYSNYYNLPNTPAGISYVYHYDKVVYRNLYNNIDLVFTIPEDKTKPVEYNFIIHEGGSIDDIRFTVKGAKTELKDNSIKIALRFGELSESMPLSWAEDAAGKQAADIQYKQIGKGLYGFTLNSPALKGKTMVIDPVPVRLWGTYFGGDSVAVPSDITSDINNDIYIGGGTNSTSNIATEGTFQSTYITQGFSNGYIDKFTPDGQRIWGTYYAAGPNALTIDSNFNVVFCGYTIKEGLQNLTSPGCYQPSKHTYTDGFVVKLNAAGQRMWGTYYGGEQNDYAYGVATDAGNNVYMAGETFSGQNIGSPGSFQPGIASTAGNATDAMVVKFSPGGNRLWATYYGGPDGSDGFYDIKEGSDGSVYALGTSDSAGMATSGTYKEILTGGSDGLVVKFDINGNRVWATYIGGDAPDAFLGSKLKGDNLYLYGVTISTSGIATADSFIPDMPVGDNIQVYFVMNFNIATQQRVWGTYFNNQITSLDVNQNGETFFCGNTFDMTGITTPDSYMPVKDNYQKTYLIKLNTVGQRAWGTYYGGDKAEAHGFVTVDTANDIYMHGVTNGSTTGLTTTGAWQTTVPASIVNGSTYLVKFRDCTSFSSASGTSVCVGQTLQLHAQGGSSYAWTGPNNFTSSLANPAITQATTAASGLYSCAITGGAGCDATIAVPVTVGDTTAPLPVVQPLPALTADCSLTVTTIPVATDACDGTVNATTTDALQYTIAGAYTINWQYTDSSGNTATQQQTVVVTPSSIPVLAEYTLPGCENPGAASVFNLTLANIPLTADTGALFTYYLTQQDAIDGVNAISGPAAFPAQQSRDVYARVQLSNGCSSLATIHLVINPLPVVQPAVLTQCVGTGIQIFNLTAADALIDPSNTMVVHYYETQAGLANDTPIANPAAFTPQGSQLWVYAKATNAAGCYAATTVQLIPAYITELALTDDNQCGTEHDEPVAFALASHFNEILQMVPSGNYTFTLYDDYNDAMAGNTNVVSDTYMLASGSKDIYYRVTGTGCPYVTHLKLNVIEAPKPDIAESYYMCKGDMLTVAINPGFDTYEWSSGSLQPKEIITAPGNYSVTVSKITNGLTCYTTHNFTVAFYEEPHIDTVTVGGFIGNEKTITIYPYNPGFEYSVNGYTYQDSNIFTGLETGNYNVYIKDRQGCGIATATAVLLAYPNFFTPNNDGQNDYWHIRNSDLNEGMLVFVYDRYGKLITSLGPKDRGWDGTFNGRPLPATDYWFVLQRKNGSDIKGHFSLFR